ncbi:hypothetical protein [Streptomyces brasiliscabiei]|uniref:hypothetical protein n=1 Tax=Streptomyces brasiliscabiei TaxID=2736302 RepID=UPI001C102D61|nr:hypothetical protein [Streptomyces brasiliscabiei]
MSAAALGAAVPAANASSSAGDAGSAPADATSRPSVSRSFTLPRGGTRSDLSLGSAGVRVAKSAEDVITCTLTLYGPYKAPGEDGIRLMGTSANVRCTDEVQSLQIQLVLARNGTTVAAQANQNHGSAYIEANAATVCLPGSWTSQAQSAIVFPPGQQPRTSNLGAAGPVVAITSCSPTRSGQNG